MSALTRLPAADWPGLLAQAHAACDELAALKNTAARLAERWELLGPAYSREGEFGSDRLYQLLGAGYPKWMPSFDEVPGELHAWLEAVETALRRAENPAPHWAEDGVVQVLTTHTFRCVVCGRLARATRGALEEMRASYSEKDDPPPTDAEIANCFEYCLWCCSDHYLPGERDPYLMGQPLRVARLSEVGGAVAIDACGTIYHLPEVADHETGYDVDKDGVENWCHVSAPDQRFLDVVNRVFGRHYTLDQFPGR